jgi:hypothetical protein
VAQPVEVLLGSLDVADQDLLVGDESQPDLIVSPPHGSLDVFECARELGTPLLKLAFQLVARVENPSHGFLQLSVLLDALRDRLLVDRAGMVLFTIS